MIKDHGKIFYSTRDILKESNINRKTVFLLEKMGFIRPTRRLGNRKYYSRDEYEKLKNVGHLLKKYDLKTIVNNYDKLKYEVKLMKYEDALRSIKARIEKVLNSSKSPS